MTLANKITCLRVVLIPAFMVLMLLSGGDGDIWMKSALVVFIIACVSDFIDGCIARKYNQISELGKFMDPLADKLLVLSAMVILCNWDKFPSWALMIVLTREFAVTGLRMVASNKGTVIPAGISGKIKTACTMIGLCVWMAFIDYPVVGTVVTVVIAATTLYSGIDYFIKNRKFLQC